MLLETSSKLVELGSCVWARDWLFRTPLQVVYEALSYYCMRP
jgi:hypothetical protein